MKKKLVISILIIGLICISNGIVNNFRIVETDYQITSDKVDQDYTFALITDYHSETKDNDKIFNIIKQKEPDYILLAGDILDSEAMDETVDFVSQLTSISQVVYARGNHDNDYQTYDQFKTAIADLGVITIDSSNYQTEDLNFIGLEDYSGANFGYSQSFADSYIPYIESYEQYVSTDKFNVLLAHRPNFFEAYQNLGVDLVVSGHAHGGQWQIPFTSIGLIAPDEGLFPTNVEGLETKGGVTQVISTGTSNPYGPVIPRLFNPREVVIIDVEKD